MLVVGLNVSAPSLMPGLDIGSGSRNRTVGGADLLFIADPVLLKLDFMDEYFGLLAGDEDNDDEVEDDEESLDSLQIDDAVERLVEIGVVLPLEVGVDMAMDGIKLTGKGTGDGLRMESSRGSEFCKVSK